MSLNILSNRYVLGALALFVLLIAGSLIYEWHVRRTTDAELARVGAVVESIEERKKTHTTEVEQGPVETQPVLPSEPPRESDELHTLFPKPKQSMIEATRRIASPVSTSTEGEGEQNSPYGVSPYGFGPYPEVPAGFPEHLDPIWTWSQEKRSGFTGGKSFELMHRVLIKLWNQGDRDFVGVTRADDNGRVYPLYPRTVYVRWREATDPYGSTHRYPGLTLAGPDVPRSREIDFKRGEGYPPHITVLDRETSGIEPYQFLGLQKR